MMLLDQVPQEAYARIKLCRQAPTDCTWEGALGGAGRRPGAEPSRGRFLSSFPSFSLFPPHSASPPRRSRLWVGKGSRPFCSLVLLDAHAVPRCATLCRAVLCRTVLSDHVIPNYLRALESALERIQEHVPAADHAPHPQPHPHPAAATETAPPALSAATAMPGAAAAAESGSGGVAGSRSGKQD
jgi:hypothetical protein